MALEFLTLTTDEQLKEYYVKIVKAIGEGDYTALIEHTATCAVCKSGHMVEINNMLTAGMTIENVQTWCEDNDLIIDKLTIKRHKTMLPLMIAVEINKAEKAGEVTALQTDLKWLIKKSDHARATHLLKMWDKLLPPMLERIAAMLEDDTVPFQAIVNAYEKVIDLSLKVHQAVTPDTFSPGKGTGGGSSNDPLSAGLMGAIIGAYAERTKVT